MNKKFTRLTAALALLLFIAPPMVGWGQTRETVTDLMDQTWTGVTGTSYVQVEGLEGSASDAVYTVQCAGDKSSIQLRSKNSNSGIVSTTSGGTLTKVTVTWNSETQSGNKLDIYGKATAYSAPTDLYNSNTQGTLLGSIVKGTSTELTINGNYTFIGMRSNSGAIYLTEIDVEWETGGTSGPTTYTVTYDANGGTGTMVDENSPYEEGDDVELLDNAFEAPEGMIWDSWEVKDANDNDITVTEGTFTMPASNVTVTAQWIIDPSAPTYEWVLANLADLTEDDVFVIVGTVSNTPYSMSNNSTSSPVASTVTIENGKITSTVADNLKWNVSGNATDGYTFYPNGSTTTWLYCNTTASSGSNTNLRVGGGNNATRKLFIPDGTTLKTKDSNTARYWNVYSSGPDWRGYVSNSTSTTVTFYKRQIATTDPVINATDVNIAYDATSGEIEYTITNPATNGNLTVSENVDWISNATVNTSESKVTFTTTANEATTAREGVITLTYTYGDNETVTKDVTVTQAAAPVIYTTIPAIFAAATSTETNVNVTFGNWVVSGVSGSNAFVTDNEGNGFIIYTSNHGFAVNDKLSGTVMGTPLKLYKGSAEFTNLTASTSGLSVSHDGGITIITDKAIAELGGVNTGAVITLNNLTYDGTNLSDGTNTIKPYYTLYSEMSFTSGKTYNVTGVYQQFDNTKEILPRSANDIVEVVPSTPYINLETYLIETIASPFDGSYDITYGNLEIQGVNDFTIQFYSDAQGTTAIEHPDWIITNEVTPYQEGYRLHIATSINLGDARTTYLKVSVGNTSSELVTVTQAAPVVDYAVLPFDYEGGVLSDFSGLNGTSYSLDDNGSYAATNAPYRIKFTKTGDYLQVKCNEQPGKVTIGVKVFNSSNNNSKITVQGSADGQSFTDIEELTIDASTAGVKDLETTANFDATHRYVRLLFTKGVNVGVGPITIAEYVAPENHDLIVTLSENVEAIFVFNAANLNDALIENGAAGTVQVLEGTSIVVSPVAASGYVISSLIVDDVDVTSQMDETGAYTFPMPANDVTITATATLEPHIIMFSVNGYEFEEGEMAITPGQPLGELPVPSENIPEGFTFVGWMESPTDAYYNATSAPPTMVNSTTVPEDDMILDAVFCISETEQGTYVLNNAAPTDGDWVVLAVNVDGTYYAMNGPAVEALDVANNTIVGTPDAAFEAKKITQNQTDYIGLTKDGGTQYVHLNSNAIKIANGETNGYLEFTQSGTGYLVSTEATTNNGVVTRYIKYNPSNFTVTTDETEASTLYVFTYVPGATTTMDYTTLVTVHESGYIANNQAETLYGIHYIDGYVFAGDEVTNSGKLVVNNGGTLDMYGSELVNTEVANFVIKDGGQYKGDEVLATVEKVILPYTPGVKNNWYAISMPFKFGINPGIDGYMTEMVTDNDNELTYDFYRFDNLYLKAEWRNHRMNDGFGMTVGQGYLYAHKNGITLNFTGTLNATTANITSTVFNNGSSNYPDTYPFADWFFAGNPFPCSATIVGFEDFYVMNESGSNFVLSEGGVLNPLQGAMIYDAEAPTGNDYTITYQVQGMSKSNNGNETDKGMINLSISQDNELVDMARVRFGEGSMLGKFTLNENNTKLYIPQGKKDYAVVRAQSEGEMPVSFKAESNGTYTLSVNPENVEMTYLHLIDNKTGADVDLLATPSYSFEARTTDYASRFRLVFNANNGSNENGNETFAYYNGSEWVISNMGDATLQVVDVMGRVLSTETVSGNATINLNQTPGVYMFRLVNGDSVKVQKVVVR